MVAAFLYIDRLLQGWPTIQKPRATFLIVFLQRVTSYTRYNDRMNITPSLTHTL